MSGNQAIDSIGMYPGMYLDPMMYPYMDSTYSYGNMNNPYMQYYTQNYLQNYNNNTSFKGGNSGLDFAQMASASGYTDEASSAQSSITTTQQTPEKKKFGIGKILLATAIVAGTALTIAANRKGAKNLDFFPRIADGYKQIFNGIKKNANDVTQKFSLVKKGDKSFFTIPGKSNRISGSNPKLADMADELGIDINTPDLTDALKNKAATLRRYDFMEDGYKISVRRHLNDKTKGSIVAIAADGKKLYEKDLMNATDDTLKNLYTKIKTSMDKFNAGDDLNRLSKIEFATGNKAELLKVYSLDAVDNVKVPKLKTLHTNRFGKNSPQLDAYRRAYPDIDEAIKKMDFENDWKVVEGFFNADTHYGNGKFKIVNDEVVGVTIGNHFYPESSDMFQSIVYREPKIRENILSKAKEFYDVTYHLA